MQPGIPAHDALWIAIGARCGSAPGPGWKCPRGRPRITLAEQLSRDLGGMDLWEAWYLAMDMDGWRELIRKQIIESSANLPYYFLSSILASQCVIVRKCSLVVALFFLVI